MPSGHLNSQILQHGQRSFSISILTWSFALFFFVAFLTTFPSAVNLVTSIKSRGHASSHSTQSLGHLLVSTWMSRINWGKLSFSTTERICSPLTVTFTAPYGHSMSHIPQKLHFAKSMSILAFLAFSPWILGCFSSLIASFGQAKVQIWQPRRGFCQGLTCSFLPAKSILTLMLLLCLFLLSLTASD